MSVLLNGRFFSSAFKRDDESIKYKPNWWVSRRYPVQLSKSRRWEDIHQQHLLSEISWEMILYHQLIQRGLRE